MASPQLKVTWYKLPSGLWCPLEGMDFSRVSTAGVYTIWHAGNPGRYVRVGQGLISDRAGCHASDPKITAYGRLGKLYVTWAAVPERLGLRDGVERYLAESLQPLVGDRFPDVASVLVNLPHHQAA